MKKSIEPEEIQETNNAQRNLAETVAPFSFRFNEILKEVDRKVRHFEKEQNKNRDLKALKTELETLHKEVKATEYFSAILPG